MSIKVNGQTIPVTIAEMEPLFNPNSSTALNEDGLRLILQNTNDEGKKNWLTLAKKYNRPKEIAQAKGLTYLIIAGVVGIGGYLLYKRSKKK
jgi:hypothetical protein